ncbi:TetR/AcrR family transcriptional regulator [uncultured Shewanella sp.]|uniref:TetR/AcrR family transcriptional regulator n=1 Tax=uncultured Shewanella sp. TaxID=173975 RepID=UPI00262CD86C|nr:TetR/AcrR family transcriptional regulator [uncultured Shewanella sp.]
MPDSKNKVGRPSGETQNRDKLVQAARALFVERDYSQVTIRDVAALAGTDPGLIRYYFGSKENLFTAMLRETAAPVKQQLYKVIREKQASGPASFMQTYYQVMSAYPHFPRLIFRLAGLDQSIPENKEITKVFNEIVDLDDIMMFDKLKERGLLRDDVDSLCAQLSFISMTIFPFLVPEELLNRLGIQLTPEFLTKLAEQNTNLLARGLMPTKDQSHDK